MDVCSGVQYAHTYPGTDPAEHVCVYMCPEGYYGYWGQDMEVKVCMDVCPEGTYG